MKSVLRKMMWVIMTIIFALGSSSCGKDEPGESKENATGIEKSEQSLVGKWVCVEHEESSSFFNYYYTDLKIVLDFHKTGTFEWTQYYRSDEKPFDGDWEAIKQSDFPILGTWETGESNWFEASFRYYNYWMAGYYELKNDRLVIRFHEKSIYGGKELEFEREK